MVSVEWPSESASIGWSDEPTRASLQVIAEAVAAFARFESSAISVEHDGVLEVVAASGNNGVVEAMLGTELPVEVLVAELAKADHWGALHFVPHDRVGADVLDYSFVSDMVPLDATDAWHPLDLLMAPFYNDAGVLCGLLSVDLPLDGRRPDAAQIEVLNKYAEVTRCAVLLAREREELAERVRLATAARDLVRRAAAGLSLDLVIEECRAAMVSCFGAVGMWIQTFDDDGWADSTWYSERGHDLPLFPELVEVGTRAARRFWADQYVAHFSGDRMVHTGLTAEDADLTLAFLTSIDVGAILFVPLGAGHDCLGFLVLSRTPEAPDWSEIESRAAMDIGLDLGRVVANARRLEREHELVAELQALDTYKSQLICTVAHELRNPLGATVGNLELIETEVSTDGGARALRGATRGTRRMERVIDDLLAMAQVGDPLAHFDEHLFDLCETATDVVEEHAPAAARRQIDVVVRRPDEPLLFRGDPGQLHRAVSNLVSNALKYSPDRGTITLTLTEDDDGVRVSCRDDGIGISAADQKRLFTEFFRSTNPTALALPGTGLGLAITERIVRRHRGRINVVSELGAGATFTVFLPVSDTT